MTRVHVSKRWFINPFDFIIQYYFCAHIKPVFGCVRVSLQMSWTSTMSSGYSSLEEDSEEYFFTARTSLFKKPSVKPTNLKVNLFTLCLLI